ncbi:MAG: SpoIID/LytB domain-containing protein [Candidatus Obscuribacterales bacterium]
MICFTTPDQKTVEARNLVDARDYIIAVLGSETLPQWCSEALKAQAVLTQSRLSRYKRGDLLDDTTQA